MILADRNVQFEDFNHKSWAFWSYTYIFVPGSCIGTRYQDLWLLVGYWWAPILLLIEFLSVCFISAKNLLLVLRLLLLLHNSAPAFLFYFLTYFQKCLTLTRLSRMWYFMILVAIEMNNASGGWLWWNLNIFSVGFGLQFSGDYIMQ